MLRRKKRNARKTLGRQLSRRSTIEQLEIRRLLTISPDFDNTGGIGVLTVTSDADDPIIISAVDGLVQIEGVDLSATPINANLVKHIFATGGPGTDTIDLSGVTSASFNLMLDTTIRFDDGSSNQSMTNGQFHSGGSTNSLDGEGDGEGDDPGDDTQNPEAVQFSQLAAAIIGEDWADQLGIEDVTTFLESSDWRYYVYGDGVTLMSAVINPVLVDNIGQQLLGPNWQAQAGITDLADYLSSGAWTELFPSDSGSLVQRNSSLHRAANHFDGLPTIDESDLTDILGIDPSGSNTNSQIGGGLIDSPTPDPASDALSDPTQFIALATALIGPNWQQQLGITDSSAFFGSNQWRQLLNSPQLNNALDPARANTFLTTALGANWQQQLGIANLSTFLSSGGWTALLNADASNPQTPSAFVAARDQITEYLQDEDGAGEQQENSGGGGSGHQMFSNMLMDDPIPRTVIGSHFADTIDGTDGDDNIDGGEGDDTINTYQGTDIVDGGEGKDIITSQDGDNTLDGGEGDDTITAGRGTNTLDGGEGNDHLTVGAGTAQAKGNNILIGGDGADILDGGEGNDELYGDGDGGPDDTSTHPGNDTLDGGEGDDALSGGGGNDYYAFTGPKKLGSDTISDTIGSNYLDFSQFGSAVTVNLASTGGQQIASTGSTALILTGFQNISNVIGSAYNDTLTSNSLGAHLYGGDGNDALVVPAGIGAVSYSLDGGAGFDTVKFSPTATQTNVALTSNHVTIGNGPTITFANTEAVSALDRATTFTATDSVGAILPALTLVSGSQVAWDFSGLPVDNYQALLNFGSGGPGGARFNAAADGVSQLIDVDESLGSAVNTAPWYSLGTFAVTGGLLSMSLTQLGVLGPINLNSFELVRAAGAATIPSTPILDTASDSGALHDGVTNSALAPVFVGTANIGDTLKIYADGTLIGSQVITDGTYRVTGSAALSAGQHVITAEATNASQTIHAPAALLVTIDRTAPATPPPPTLDIRSDAGAAPSSRWTRTTTPTFVGSAEPDSLVEIFADGLSIGSGIAVGGSYRIVATSALGQGGHNITAKATDAAGNTSNPSSALAITTDSVAPTPPAAPILALSSDTGVADGTTNNVTPTFTGTVANGVSIQILSDGALVGTGPIVANAYSVTVSRLGVGTHHITARTVDAAGNVSAESVLSTPVIIKANPAAPSVPVLRAADDLGSSSSDRITNVQTPTFTGTAEPGVTVQIFSDGVLSGLAVANSLGAYSVAIVSAHALTAGSHSITANAVDIQDGVSPFTAAATVTIILAAAAPSAPQLTGASDSGGSRSDNVTNVKRPTFTGIATAGSAVQLFVDGAPAASGVATGGVYSIALASDLTDNTHTITAVATDIAGNTSAASAVSTIKVQTVAPAAPTAPIQDATHVTTFTGSATHGATVLLYMTPTAFGSTAVQVGSATADDDGHYSIVASGLVNGSLNMTARVVDDAGNVSTSTATLISFAAPTFVMVDGATTLSSASTVNLGTTFAGKVTTRTFQITNSGGAPLTLSEPVLPDGFSVLNDYGITTLAPNASTQITIRLDAAAAGTYGGLIVIGSNDSSRSPFSFKLTGVVTAAGVIDDTTAAGFAKTGSGWLTEQTAPTAYSGNFLQSTGGAANTATWTFSNLAPGAYRVYAHWSAVAGAAATATYTVFDGTTQLAATDVHQQDSSTGLSDGGYNWQVLSSGVALVGNTLRVTLASGGVIIADAVRIERVVNQAPTLDAIGDQSVNAGSTLTVPTTAHDSDGNTLTYSLGDGAPTGASINPTSGLFSWPAPYVASGATSTVYNIQVIVSDGQEPALTAAQNFAIVVYASNQAPAVLAIPNQTVNATHQLSFQVQAHDPDGAASDLSYSLASGSAPGASISLTGLFQWTPLAAQAGATYPVTVQVTDAHGAVTAQAFHVTVGSDTPAGSLSTVATLQLVNNIGTSGAPAASDLRVAGTVANSSASVVNVPVQFDVNGDGIADGTVFTTSGGQFLIDLSAFVFDAGAVHLKVWAGAAGPDGVTYGTSTTFTFQYQPPADATGVAQSYLPSDIGDARFATSSLAPSVTIPTQGSPTTFAGGGSYGASFASFASRFTGPSTNTDSPTSTSDANHTHTTTDHLVTHINPTDGSWTIDETFTTSYAMATTVLTGGLPSSTLVQTGSDEFVFHASGNATSSSYTLVEVRTDRSQLHRNTNSSSTTDATASDDTQAFTLTESGTSTVTGGQRTSTENYSYNSSDNNHYSNNHVETTTSTGSVEVHEVNQAGDKGWSYSFNRVINTAANSSTSGTESYAYSTHDNIGSQTDRDTLTSLITTVNGGASTTTSTSKVSTLTGSSTNTYSLSGSRTNNSNGTFTLSPTTDHTHKDSADSLTATQHIVTDINDVETNANSVSHNSSNSNTQRTRTFSNDVDGVTTFYTTGGSTYSATTGGSTHTIYSSSGDSDSQSSGTDDSAPGVSASFTASNSTTFGLNGNSNFISNGAIAVSSAHVRTETGTSTSTSEEHGDTSWNTAESSQSTTNDTSVPVTVTLAHQSDSDTDVGTSHYDTTANGTMLTDANGAVSSNGGTHTTYSGSGDTTFHNAGDASSVVTSGAAASGSVLRSTTSNSSAVNSGSGHYTPSGGQDSTIVNGVTTVSTQYSHRDETGAKDGSESGHETTKADDQQLTGFHGVSTETSSSSGTQHGTYTSHADDSTSTYSDGTYESTSSSSYIENGSTHDEETHALTSHVDDNSVTKIAETSDEESEGQSTDDGTYHNGTTSSSSHTTDGVNTAHGDVENTTQGSSTESDSGTDHSKIVDTTVGGLTTTSTRDASDSDSESGSYSTDHQEHNSTIAGVLASTSSDSSISDSTGNETSEVDTTEQELGTITLTSGTKTLDSSNSTKDHRTGAVTLHDDSSSSTNANGTSQSNTHHSRTVTGNFDSEIKDNDDSSQTTNAASVLTVYTEKGNDDDTSEGEFSHTDSSASETFANGTHSSSNSTSDSEQGTAQNDSTMTTTTNVTDTATPYFTKTSNTSETTTISSGGPVSSSFSDSTIVDVRGVTTATHTEVFDKTDSGSISLKEKTHEHVEEEGHDIGNNVSRNSTADDDDVENSTAKYTEVTHSNSTVVNGVTTSLNTSSYNESGTHDSTEEETEDSTTLSSTADLGVLTTLHVEEDIKVPYGTYATQKASSTQVFAGGAVVTSSSDSESEDDNIESKTLSDGTATTTDTRVAGVTAHSTVKDWTERDGGGNAASSTSNSTKGGVTTTKTTSSDDIAGTFERKHKLDADSSGIPTDKLVAGATYTTKTATSESHEDNDDNGTFDDSDESTSTSVSGAIVASTSMSHEHEEFTPDDHSWDKSDGEQVGKTANGTFNNKSHTESDTTSTGDEVTDNKTTKVNGVTTAYTKTDNVTGGKGTQTSNNNATNKQTGAPNTTTTTGFETTTSSVDDVQSTFTAEVSDTLEAGSTTVAHFDHTNLVAKPGDSGHAHTDTTTTTSTETKFGTNDSHMDVKVEKTTKNQFDGTLTTDTTHSNKSSTTQTTIAGKGNSTKSTATTQSETNWIVVEPVGGGSYAYATEGKRTTDKTVTTYTASGSRTDNVVDGQTAPSTGTITYDQTETEFDIVDQINTNGGGNTAANPIWSTTGTTTYGTTASTQNGVTLVRTPGQADVRTITSTTSLPGEAHASSVGVTTNHSFGPGYDSTITSTSTTTESQTKAFLKTTTIKEKIDDTVTSTERTATASNTGTHASGHVTISTRTEETVDTPTGKTVSSISSNKSDEVSSSVTFDLLDGQERVVSSVTNDDHTSNSGTLTSTYTDGVLTKTVGHGERHVNKNDTSYSLAATEEGQTTAGSLPASSKIVTDNIYDFTLDGSGQPSAFSGTEHTQSNTVYNPPFQWVDLTYDDTKDGALSLVGGQIHSVVSDDWAATNIYTSGSGHSDTGYTVAFYQPTYLPGAYISDEILQDLQPGWLAEFADALEAMIATVNSAQTAVANYVVQIYTAFEQDPWGATADFFVGALDGFVHTVIPPIPFLGELPHLQPYYGHADVFALGSGIGTVTGVVAGFAVGNIASGANGLVACGGLAQNLAKLYTAADTALGIANAAVNIAQTGSIGVGDVLALAPALGWGVGKMSSARYCFFAGTPVATEYGDRPIESIEAGDRVWSCDLTNGEWRLCVVGDKFVSNYTDLRVDVFVAGERIGATHDHPFWVVRGDQLAERPTPEHVASATIKNAVISGRWVTAGDLRVGDTLLLIDGRRVPIEQIQIQQAEDLVYNFAVEPYHTYAVGLAGVLVHNSTCGDAATKSLRGRQLPEEFSGSYLKKMKNTMKAEGFIWEKVFEPIEIAIINGKNIIIDGHNRARAAGAAGIKRVPVKITEVASDVAAKYFREAAEAAERIGLPF